MGTELAQSIKKTENGQPEAATEGRVNNSINNIAAQNKQVPFMVFLHGGKRNDHTQRAEYGDKDSVSLVCHIIIEDHSIPPFIMQP